MGELYLKLDQPNIPVFDFGYTISGSVFENKAMTIPHDLTAYDSVEFRTFRPGDTFVPVRLDATVNTANTNQFSIIVRRGTFIYDGIFECVLGLISTGINRSTKPRQLLVRNNGNIVQGITSGLI